MRDGKKEIRKHILTISEGFLGTTTNLLLFSIFWVGSSVGKSGSMGAARAFEEAFEQLGEVNYATIKRAFYQLKKRRLVKSQVKGKKCFVSLTNSGKREIKKALPVYNRRRSANWVIYMVTYDIPETHKSIRDTFRRFLKSLGCVMLQKSVWLTLKDPSEVISAFIKKHQMPGAVIVSEFSKKGSVGEEDVKSLIQRLFRVDELNRRYREFTTQVTSKEKITARDYLSFLSILKNDPQLPRELLPEDWWGDKAYRPVNKPEE